MSAKVVQKMVRWSEVNKRVSPSVGLPIARRALRCAARLMLRSLHLFFSLPTILHALALSSPFKHSSWSPKSCIVILIPYLFISSMDASLPYFSAIDDYSLFNMYKHTALKTYSPFLRKEDFLHPGSHGDMENMNSLITMSNHHANLPANKLIHSSSAAFHCYQGLKQKRGVSSEDARTEALSDLCDINGFPAETKDRDAAVEIIIPSDGSIHGCFERHYNNCTDGNIWASSSSGQISVALTEFDIRKGKKRSFVRNESKNTAKEGQTKRPSSSKKGKSPSTQKAAGSPANVKKINAEPPKDFIHVRARRGQATDSHSLAERVRREKINERLRFLKNLVPGCSKTVGKAGMLEEIINYVQSLQRQIEFLSMKLAAVSPPYDFSDELNSSSKEPLSQQPGVADGGGVLVPSFSFEVTTHDSKRAFTASRGETP